MLTYIEKLRTRPKAVRIQVALVSAALVTSVIAIAWLVSVPSKLVELQEFVVDEQQAQAPPQRTFWQKLQVATGITAWPELLGASEPAAVPTATTSVSSTTTPEASGASTTPTSAVPSRIIQIATSSVSAAGRSTSSSSPVVE